MPIFTIKRKLIPAARCLSLRLRARGKWWLLSALLLLQLPLQSATARDLVVLYPDIRAPYDAVFKQILQGVAQEGGRVQEYRLDSNQLSDRIVNRIQGGQTRAVIALGRRGLRASQTLGNVPVVAGAVLMQPGKNSENVRGISFMPDPAIQLQRLKSLVGTTQRVFVIYQPAVHDQLIERARNAGRKLGLQVLALPASDRREAARLSRRVLKTDAQPRDSIWLLQNANIIDDQDFLKVALELAWDRHLVLFSSRIDHVERGVLFSVYPDAVAMGRSLARLALNPKTFKQSPEVQPLRDLHVAVNLRIAKHLGLSIRDRRQFNLVYPPRR